MKPAAVTVVTDCDGLPACRIGARAHESFPNDPSYVSHASLSRDCNALGLTNASGNVSSSVIARDELTAKIGRLPVTERQYQAAMLWREDEAAAQGGGGRSARSPYERQVDDRVDGRRGETEQERVVEAKQRLVEIGRLGGGDAFAMGRALVVDQETAGVIAERHGCLITTVGDMVRMLLDRAARQVYRLRA